MILDIPVNLTVELGRTKIAIRNLLQLAQGSAVELDGMAGEPMDVLVNGYLIAQGEVVVVNDKFGIRRHHHAVGRHPETESMKCVVLASLSALPFLPLLAHATGMNAVNHAAQIASSVGASSAVLQTQLGLVIGAASCSAARGSRASSASTE